MTVSFADLPADEQVTRLRPLVLELLAEYPFEVAEVASLNHAFNSTWQVRATTGEQYALRVNVNSARTLENLNAEIAMVTQLPGRRQTYPVKVPQPVANKSGGFITVGWSEALGRNLPSVLYTWLDGQVVGENPTTESLFSAGIAMAHLHLAAEDYNLPADARLGDLSDALWGTGDNLTAVNPALDATAHRKIRVVIGEIQNLLDRLYSQGTPIVLHADMHGWNLMWDGQQIAVFDFDDSALGFPIQDLATAIYYLDDEQAATWRSGYESVTTWPDISDDDWETLLLQRRLYLQNYIFVTADPVARSKLANYLPETIRRVDVYLKRRGLASA